MTTDGNGSTFTFFLLGVPAPLPFFPSPPVLIADMSGGGGTGPGVAGGASPSAGGAAPPIPDADPGGAAGGFALLFFFVVPDAGVALFTVPSGPILVCEGLGASSGRTMTAGASGAPGGICAAVVMEVEAGLIGIEGSVGADGMGVTILGGRIRDGCAGKPGPAGGGTPRGCAGATREADISAIRD